MPKQKKIAPVRSLAELNMRALVDKDDRYGRLLDIAAENLGGEPRASRIEAMQWLVTNAMETSEQAVLEEVNSCRDMV